MPVPKSGWVLSVQFSDSEEFDKFREAYEKRVIFGLSAHSYFCAPSESFFAYDFIGEDHTELILRNLEKEVQRKYQNAKTKVSKYPVKKES